MSEQGKPAASFEAGLQELEAIVKQMEASDLPLEKALELFEKGMQLSETCRKQLEEAETRIEVLVRKGDKVQADVMQTTNAIGFTMRSSARRPAPGLPIDSTGRPR